jgi:hypothetical protein
MLAVHAHLEDAAAALARFRQLLKPGGLATLIVPALQSLWSVHDMINLHYRRYDKTGLQRLLKVSDFAVRGLQYFFSWSLGLMYVRKLWYGTKPRTWKSYKVPLPSLPVNRLFAGLSRIEQRLLQLGVHWPLGSSLLAVIERPRASSLDAGVSVVVSVGILHLGSAKKARSNSVCSR